MSSRSSSFNGATRAGTAMLARIAVGSRPWSSTTILPSPRLVATARKGIGSWSKGRASCTLTRRRSSASSATPVTTPLGVLSLPSFTPSSGAANGCQSLLLTRIGSSPRGGLSPNSRSLLILAISSSICWVPMPEA